MKNMSLIKNNKSVYSTKINHITYNGDRKNINDPIQKTKRAPCHKITVIKSN